MSINPNDHPKAQILINLYRMMADHTKPMCGKSGCRTTNEYRCCSRFYCEMAKQWAKDIWDIKLKETGHPKLPFMGLNGCTVPPYLRPNCTLHQCSINNIGTIPGKDKWNDEYFRLRHMIDEFNFEVLGDKL